MGTIRIAALCAAASLCAASAFAQESDSTDGVTLYGRVYVMFDSVEAKGGTAAPLPRRNRVTDQSSLLGVRGVESLGSGMKAFFQLETAFAPDANAGTFATRNSAVGLNSSQWGSIIMGRWDMPMKTAQAAPLDPFTDLALADITGVALNQGNFSNREQNVVQYWSPNFAGLEVRLAYSANEARVATRNPYKTGASVVWSNRDLYLTYAYEKHYDTRDGTATAGVDETGNGIGGYVRLAGAKIMAQYGRYTRTGTLTQKGYALGLDWVFAGPHHLLAIYQNSKDGGTIGQARPSCDLVGVGYRYDFSRRTFFTVYYTKVDNKTGNLCNFGAGALANVAEGQDPQGISAGFRHVF